MGALGSPNPNLLQVTWRGDISEEYFSIKCRTEEQLKKWQAAITKAVDEAVDRRRKHVHHLSSSSRIKANSPLSQFPNTPQSEMGPPPPPLSAGYHHSNSRINEYGHHSLHGPGSISSSSRTFDDEDDNYQTDHETSTNGRNTPAGGRRPSGHRSMPAERSGDQAFGHGRARAQTDDVTSANLSQWRSQMPSSMPPLPRSSQTTMTTMSGGEAPSSLRSSTSSRHLRHKQSHEWGASSSSVAYRAEDEAMAHLPPAGHHYQHPAPRQSSHAPPSRQPSGQPAFRGRSASSPNIHQPELNGQWGPSNGGQPLPNVPSLPPGARDHRAGPPPSSHTSSTAHRRSDHLKRSSVSSAGTDRSSLGSQTQLNTGMC